MTGLHTACSQGILGNLSSSSQVFSSLKGTPFRWGGRVRARNTWQVWQRQSGQEAGLCDVSRNNQLIHSNKTNIKQTPPTLLTLPTFYWLQPILTASSMWLWSRSTTFTTNRGIKYWLRPDWSHQDPFICRPNLTPPSSPDLFVAERWAVPHGGDVTGRRQLEINVIMCNRQR